MGQNIVDFLPRHVICFSFKNLKNKQGLNKIYFNIYLNINSWSISKEMWIFLLLFIILNGNYNKIITSFSPLCRRLVNSKVCNKWGFLSAGLLWWGGNSSSARRTATTAGCGGGMQLTKAVLARTISNMLDVILPEILVIYFFI